jgi:hypothetical protein
MSAKLLILDRSFGEGLLARVMKDEAKAHAAFTKVRALRRNRRLPRAERFEVRHFEIYTDDPETVRPFYESVFG